MSTRPRIRYLAITAREPAALANFYATYFDMWLLGQNDDGDIAMTDGFFNLTLLKQRAALGDEDGALGVNHFGIEVDDLGEVERALAQVAPDVGLQSEPGDLFHGEARVRDPNGLPVSLSTKHFGVEHEYRPLPSIRHIALSVPNNDAVLDFYSRVFGFSATSTTEKILKQTPPLMARMAGDGSISLAILPEPALLDEPPDGHRKPGVNHFGFLVPDIDHLKRRLPVGTVKKRPSNRPFAEYRVIDPEGNQFDISSKAGFEIDYNVWVKA
jgi:catechol 2,3-dioxygenase-like lactoylglutathione lyase family enzyme